MNYSEKVCGIEASGAVSLFLKLKLGRYARTTGEHGCYRGSHVGENACNMVLKADAFNK